MPQSAHLPPLRDIIATHGLRPDKSLGQHFLLDPSLLDKIRRHAEPLAGVHVIEIGPGPGGLTRALLDSDAASVTAIEFDPRAAAACQPLAEAHPARCKIIQADALALDLATLTPAPRAVVANLPYNVGTPILIKLLTQAGAYESLTLMFQKEVAERIAAAPDTPAYGRLSILAQWLCTAAILMHIPAAAFTPPPKIDSALIRLTPHPAQPSAAHLKAMQTLTAAAFGQRRKMLRTALRALGGETLCAEAAIAPTRRAETLTVQEFERLMLVASKN